MVDDLAWFVGGDADKIRRLQSKLNDLGVGQHLKEDGVYGEKTKQAVDDAIEKVSNFLADPNKMRLFDQTVDAIASALDFAGGPQSQIWWFKDDSPEDIWGEYTNYDLHVYDLDTETYYYFESDS